MSVIYSDNNAVFEMIFSFIKEGKIVSLAFWIFIFFCKVSWELLRAGEHIFHFPKYELLVGWGINMMSS